MGNCLVTKLKGSVDNDMLFHFGYTPFEITVDSPTIFNSVNCSLRNPNPGTPNLRILGDGYFVDSNDASIGKTLDTSVIPFNKTGTYQGIYVGSRAILEIWDYDNTSYSDSVSFDFRDAKTLEVDLVTLNRIYPKGNNCGVYAPKLKGSLVDFYKNSGYYCAIHAINDGAEVIGNISDIVSYQNSPGVISLEGLVNVTGSVEGWLNNMLTKWPEPRSVVVVELKNCPKITYQGESVGSGVFFKRFSYNGTSWVEVQ